MALASVQKGLHNVSNNLNELMHAYIKHTASVLSGEDGALEGLQLSESAQSMIDEADFATKSVANLTRSLTAPVADAADADTGKTKKRKRAQKLQDPNAPKRPLTPRPRATASGRAACSSRSPTRPPRACRPAPR